MLAAVYLAPGFCSNSQPATTVAIAGAEPRVLNALPLLPKNELQSRTVSAKAGVAVLCCSVLCRSTTISKLGHSIFVN